MCDALHFGWSEVLGWRGHCKFHTAGVFLSDSSYPQLCVDKNRRVKPPCDTVVKPRKKPQLGGLY